MSTTLRRTIHMPWQGRNAAIFAARTARPQIPPGFGASLGDDPPILSLEAVKAEAAPMPRYGSLPTRLLSLLRALADDGDMLPTKLALGMSLGVDESSLRYVIAKLAQEGRIRVWSDSQSSIILLVETQQELRSRRAPARVTLVEEKA